MPIVKAIEEMTSDYLDSTDVDWYNNDGGFGTFTINLETNLAECEIITRYTETSHEHSNEWDLLDLPDPVNILDGEQDVLAIEQQSDDVDDKASQEIPLIPSVLSSDQENSSLAA